jgi:pyridinium-3,5-biscarboxylic acid mononucleotide synthase
VSVHLEPDWERRRRIGITEAVYCFGKEPRQIDHVVGQSFASAERLMLTRLSRAKYAALAKETRTLLTYVESARMAFLGELPELEGDDRVAVVTAGTSDGAVARETELTLHFHGVGCQTFGDLGVAGLHRLLGRIGIIKKFPVVIAVAGMEGALFSVLGGLVGSSIIAVPTSTGYGVARGGRLALESALASCAPGLVVVNIDNGYGAACAALRVLRATTPAE